MHKKLILLFCFIMLFQQVNLRGQEQPPVDKTKTMGVMFGTGFFQNIQLDLVNYNHDLLATSEPLIPTNIKAYFNYFITPGFAVRFASGYGFSRQMIKSDVDYSLINIQGNKVTDESVFSMSGFPVEAALIFQSGVNEKETIFFHIGMGCGYYAYNFNTQGKITTIYPDVEQRPVDTEYDNPEMTLSGWAQFFVLGCEIQLSQKIGVSLELSTIGWSKMQLENDIVYYSIYDNEIEYEIRYGSNNYNYTPKSGLDEMTVSVGLYWRL